MRENKRWYPIIINTILAAISLFFYTISKKENVNSLIILQIVIGAIIPFILIVLTDFLKIKFPTIFNILIIVLIALAIYLGNAFSFYSFISFYDKILHTYFGFICSFIIYYIFVYYQENKIKTPFLLFIVFFFTMGLGAIWEVFEYLCDLITKGDSLGVNQSINNGFHPCTDIMSDLLVTGLGTLIFYLTLLIDKCNNFSIMKKMKSKIRKD